MSKYYDASEVTAEAAKKLSEFIAEAGKSAKGQKYSQSKIDSFQKYARELANDALSEDENLLAFALAAPSVSLAVVQFRDRVNRNVTDHNFLSIYWRELGIAWNQTDGAHFWGAPFKGKWKSFVSRFLFYSIAKSITFLMNCSSSYPPHFIIEKKDCGPMQGRWLWPFSVTVVVQHVK